MAWLYSDWITLPTGTTARLTRLRLHIQEKDNAYQEQSVKYAIHGRKVDPQFGDLQKDLSELRKLEEKEGQLLALRNGDRLGFTRGRARL